MGSDLGDNCNYNSSGVVLYVGGNYNNHDQNHGLFYMNGNNSASNRNANIGSRIHADWLSSKTQIGIQISVCGARLFRTSW